LQSLCVSVEQHIIEEGPLENLHTVLWPQTSYWEQRSYFPTEITFYFWKGGNPQNVSCTGEARNIRL